MVSVLPGAAITPRVTRVRRAAVEAPVTIRRVARAGVGPWLPVPSADEGTLVQTNLGNHACTPLVGSTDRATLTHTWSKPSLRGEFHVRRPTEARTGDRYSAFLRVGMMESP
jgi:hypothetical protein